MSEVLVVNWNSLSIYVTINRSCMHVMCDVTHDFCVTGITHAGFILQKVKEWCCFIAWFQPFCFSVFLDPFGITESFFSIPLCFHTTNYSFFYTFLVNLSLWLPHSWRSKVNNSSPMIFSTFQSILRFQIKPSQLTTQEIHIDKVSKRTHKNSFMGRRGSTKPYPKTWFRSVHCIEHKKPSGLAVLGLVVDIL